MGAQGADGGGVVSTGSERLNTLSVEAALDAAAIPVFKRGPARHARLTDSERELYFWILRLGRVLEEG